MSNVINLKPKSTSEVRQVLKTITEIIDEEDIDEMVVFLHRTDKTDTYVKGVIKNRWEFVGILEDIKYWLLTPEEP